MTEIPIVLIPRENRKVSDKLIEYGQYIINMLQGNTNTTATLGAPITIDLSDTMTHWKINKWEEKGAIMLVYGERDIHNNEIEFRYKKIKIIVQLSNLQEQLCLLRSS